MKALPGGEEPDVILVSCAGAGLAADDAEKACCHTKLYAACPVSGSFRRSAAIAGAGAVARRTRRGSRLRTLQAVAGLAMKCGSYCAQVVAGKRMSEQIVKNSGLGYTIVRPGQLFEEPGGAKALVFDQGGRITQGISCADVADVCLKSLHDQAARNKAFDVCYECAFPLLSAGAAVAVAERADAHLRCRRSSADVAE